jgi:hypothetical protein
MLEDRRQLMNHEAFQVLEDVLDDEIQKTHASKSAGPRGLEWVVLRSLFRLVDSRVQALWDSASRTLSLGGIHPELVDAIERLVRLEAREDIGTSLFASLGPSGATRFKFGGGEGSTPIGHPLVTAAARVVASAAALSRTPPHLIARSLSGVPDDIRQLALLEFAFDGEHVRRRDWLWWGIDAFGVAGGLEGVDTSQMLTEVLDTALGTTADAPPSVVATITAASTTAFQAWTTARAQREHRLGIYATQASLRALHARLMGLERRRKDDGGENSEAIDRAITRLRIDVFDQENRLTDTGAVLRLESGNERAQARILLVITLAG